MHTIGATNDWVWVSVFGGSMYAAAGPQYRCCDNFYNGPGKVIALDAATGSERWSFDTPSQPFPVAESEGRVVFGTADGTVFALNAATGTIAWQATFPGIPFQVLATSSAIIVADGDPEVWGPNGIADKTRLSGRVTALDPATGDQRWEATVGRFAQRGGLDTSVAAGVTAFVATVGDDIIAVSSNYSESDEVVLLDPAGREKWSTTVPSTFSPPAVEGAVFVAGAKLQKLDLATGQTLWSVSPGSGGMFVSPVVIGDAVVAATNTNTIEARSLADGSVAGVGEFRDCGFTPVAATPYALVCGGLYRIDITPGSVSIAPVRIPQGMFQSMAFDHGEMYYSATIGGLGPPSVGRFDPTNPK